MPDLLFLTQRLPYPPQKGDKIRSWHILRHLAGRYRVHLGCFYDDPEDERHIPALEPVCASLCCLPLSRRWATLRSLGGLAAGRSLTEGYFHDRRLAAWVAEVTARHRPSRAFVFCSAMAPYLRGHRFERQVLDMVDVDSEKWRQYAGAKPWPMRWVYGREGRTLLALERAETLRFDQTLLVSPNEAALLVRRAPDTAGRVAAMGNGVDLEYFDAGHAFDSPFGTDGPAVVMTGAMDYWPNIQAAEWFAREVMPLLLARRPELRFWIVGSNPAPAVTRLAEGGAVTVTGRVPDIRPYLAHAAVVVAPLQIARGIQNKVLEAMAMARPVVATPAAEEGLNLRLGEEVATAETPAAFADAVLALLGPAGAAMGARARARVAADYRWAARLRLLDDLLDEAPAPSSSAAQPAAVA